MAKDRLKLLLVSDRSNCSPETMELIKNDIIQVISKYMEIDPEGLDIQITQVAKNPRTCIILQIFRSVSLENNIGEILCCEIIDCRITISTCFNVLVLMAMSFCLFTVPEHPMCQSRHWGSLWDLESLWSYH